MPHTPYLKRNDQIRVMAIATFSATSHFLLRTLSPPFQLFCRPLDVLMALVLTCAHSGFSVFVKTP